VSHDYCSQSDLRFILDLNVVRIFILQIDIFSDKDVLTDLDSAQSVEKRPH